MNWKALTLFFMGLTLWGSAHILYNVLYIDTFIIPIPGIVLLSPLTALGWTISLIGVIFLVKNKK